MIKCTPETRWSHGNYRRSVPGAPVQFAHSLRTNFSSGPCRPRGSRGAGNASEFVEFAPELLQTRTRLRMTGQVPLLGHVLKKIIEFRRPVAGFDEDVIAIDQRVRFDDLIGGKVVACEARLLQLGEDGIARHRPT